MLSFMHFERAPGSWTRAATRSPTPRFSHSTSISLGGAREARRHGPSDLVAVVARDAATRSSCGRKWTHYRHGDTIWRRSVSRSDVSRVHRYHLPSPWTTGVCLQFPPSRSFCISARRSFESIDGVMYRKKRQAHRSCDPQRLDQPGRDSSTFRACDGRPGFSLFSKDQHADLKHRSRACRRHVLCFFQHATTAPSSPIPWVSLEDQHLPPMYSKNHQSAFLGLPTHALRAPRIRRRLDAAPRTLERHKTHILSGGGLSGEAHPRS